MNSFYDNVKKRATTQNIIIFSIVATIIYSIMVLCTFPIIEAETMGLHAFDMTGISGYSYEYASKFLNSISIQGRTTYLWIQQPLDILYPFAISTVFTFLLIRLTKDKSNLFIFGMIPCLFDYMENIGVFNMLTEKTLSTASVFVSSILSIAKGISTAVCCILILILVIIRFFQRMQRR